MSKTDYINIRVEPKLKKRLVEEAKKEDRTLVSLVIVILKKAMKIKK